MPRNEGRVGVSPLLFISTLHCMYVLYVHCITKEEASSIDVVRDQNS